MRRLAIIFVAATVLAGCGTDHGIGDGAYDPRDSRVECFVKQGLPAHKVGQSDVLVTPPGGQPLQPTNPLDPRIEVFGPNDAQVASDDNSAADARNAK